MSLWDRLKQIGRARTEEEPAGEPNLEQALDRTIRELAAAIQASHVHFAEIVSAERQLKAERDKALEQANEWDTRARRAVLTGRDDLAQEALERKAEWERIAEEQRGPWEVQHRAVTHLRKQIQDLMRKHADAVRNRDMLLARQRALIAQERIQETLQHTRDLDPFREMHELESRAAAEAELEGLTDFEETLRQQETKQAAQKNLATLHIEYQTPLPSPPSISPWFPEEKVEKPPLPPSSPPVVEETTPLIEPWFPEEATVPAETLSESETPSDAEVDTPVDYWFPPEEVAAAPSPPLHTLPNPTTLQAGANRTLPLPASGIWNVRLGWETPQREGPELLDIAGCAVLLTGEGRVRGPEDFLFINHRRVPDGSVEHRGDTFPGEADNETFVVHPAWIAPDIEKIVFAVFLYDADELRESFPPLPAVWVRVLDGLEGDEIVTFLHHPTDTSANRVLLLGEIYRYRDNWKFRALGQGFEDLPDLLTTYGVSLEGLD